jgi:hypothetical protein
MDDRLAAPALAQARLAARSARIALMRRRIAAGSVALFVALWLALFAQLASGHDPALSKRAGSSGATQPETGNGSSGGSSAASATSGMDSNATGAASGTNPNGGYQSAPAPVVTQMS